MRAVAYIRRSKDPNEGNSSLIDQRNWITEESARRGHDLAPHDIFEEVVSAYRDRRRPQRDLLEAALTSGDVRALYVRDLDRLARRLTDTARIVDLCNRHDVIIYTHERVLAPRSPDTILLVSVLGGLAETEAATTSKRLKRTAENIRQKGGWNGPAPYGWIRPEQRNANGVKTLKLHPEESRVVRQIVEWRLNGLTVAEIVRRLSEEHVVNREGRPFQYRTIAAMLRHPLLAGYNSITAKAKDRPSNGGPDFRDTREIVYDKNGHPVKSHEPICTEEEWEALRLLMKHQPMKRTRSRANGLPLIGLVFCGICGTKMTSNRSNSDNGAYICQGRMRGKDCPGTAINAPAVERFIRDVVIGSLDNPVIRRIQAEALAERASGGQSTELTKLHEQAEQLDKSIRLLQAQVDRAPAIAMAALIDRINEEDSIRTQIESKIAAMSNGRPRAIPNINGAGFLKQGPDEQKAITRAFIRKIVIDAGDGRRGAVKGMFGSQGTNLSRIGFWYLADRDEEEPRRGTGYSNLPSKGRHQCPECEEPRIFRHKNNLRHHMNYAHPKPVPCPECGKMYPLPGLPSHRRNKHGVVGTRKPWT